MDLLQLRAYCAAKPGSSDDFPFDFETLAIRVGGKMYLLCSIESKPLSVKLKCDPVHAIELRAAWPGIVTPGYHMNKKHWNTVVFESSIPDEQLRKMIDESYALVYKGLSKAEQERIRGVS